MNSRAPLIFKFATEDWEVEQIHRLNYKTFVAEIPQHEAPPTPRLVDRFHGENTYLICLDGARLAGMLAVRGARPFSLDQKLERLDSHLPSGRRLCEVRLLAVEKRFRGAQVLQGLLALLWQHSMERDYDLAVISGTTRQLRLYEHLGFVPFGPLLGSGEARFQPMYVTLESFEQAARGFIGSAPARSFRAGAVNFLPGPVSLRPGVRRAFEQAAESHRMESFRIGFSATRKMLCELTRSQNVQLFLGSGTLANEVVGARLSLEPACGLVLSNGEFGQRLMDHARRWRLKFAALEFPWGQALDLREVRRALEHPSAPEWLWCVHCETSSGVLNDLGALRDLCAEFQVKLCLDCMSSVGTVGVDLSGVYLASCTSGKGLRSYAGIAMVFHQTGAAEGSQQLPRYLDLVYYDQQQGVPFTFSSNLLHALHAALRHVDWERRFADTRKLSAQLRSGLEESGFSLVGVGAETSPAVTTLDLPPELNSVRLGHEIQECGYLVSCNSDYLRQRNWIQVCLMGECSPGKVAGLIQALRKAVRSRNPSRRTAAVEC